jgi:hypothetical protein
MHEDYNSIQEYVVINYHDELNTDISASFRGNRVLQNEEAVMDSRENETGR